MNTCNNLFNAKRQTKCDNISHFFTMLWINFVKSTACDGCCRIPYLTYEHSTIYKTQCLNIFVDILTLIIDIITLIIFILLYIMNILPRIPCYLCDGLHYLDNYMTPEIPRPSPHEAEAGAGAYYVTTKSGGHQINKEPMK